MQYIHNKEYSHHQEYNTHACPNGAKHVLHYSLSEVSAVFLASLHPIIDFTNAVLRSLVSFKSVCLMYQFKSPVRSRIVCIAIFLIYVADKTSNCLKYSVCLTHLSVKMEFLFLINHNPRYN
nr:MAG TPA: hypothetical protein [Caudoviricetes sp.]